ncbi:MAG: hypothetical protein AAGJ84_04330 [Pseudomonadota bacterium]
MPKDPGIYVMVRRTAFFWLKPIYIGKAANLSDRLDDHEKWYKALYKYNATERHFKIIKQEDERQRVEEDLVRRYKPIMNEMLVPRSGSDAPNHKKLRSGWMSAKEYYALGPVKPSKKAKKADKKKRGGKSSSKDYWKKAA